MAKIFSPIDMQSTRSYWDSSTVNPFTAVKLESIVDPNGDSASKKITSIPSPFAQLNLVDIAYETILKGGVIAGETIYHKIISDSLDVLQILFEFDRLKEDIDILSWNKNVEVDLLKNIDGYNNGMEILGRTLETFIASDFSDYPLFKNINILVYKNGTNGEGIVIGGTTPTSLCFAANDIPSGVQITLGKRPAFTEPQALFERDAEFIKYVIGLYRFQILPNKECALFARYIDENIKKLNSRGANPLSAAELKDIQSVVNGNSQMAQTFFDNYAPLNNSQGAITVSSVQLYMRQSPVSQISTISDLRVDSTFTINGVSPLVIPHEKIAANQLRYTNSTWNNDWEGVKCAPANEADLCDRRLPYVGDIYPYLTVDDLLEPYIIRLIYPINNKSFFDGYVDSNDKGYLLPLKKEFFNFFDTDYLKEKNSGRPNFQIESFSGGAVRVTLRVKIANGYIDYRRTYYNQNDDYEPKMPNVAKNEGAIIETQFGLSVFPFYQIQSAVPTEYRVRLIDRDMDKGLDKKICSYALSFYKLNGAAGATAVNADDVVRSTKAASGSFTSKYHLLKQNFDVIQVANNWGTGMLIPNFFKPEDKRQGGDNNKFTFAIDFGTSNTHIAYKRGEELMSFKIDADRAHFASLHNADKATEELVKGIGAQEVLDMPPLEFVPAEIGNEFHFPMRTSIAHNNGQRIKEAKSLAHTNIAYCYEKYCFPEYMHVQTNIKWDGSENENESYYRVYFDQLMMTIRHKVIMDKGDLENVNLVWFYPSSMSTVLRQQMEDAWTESFKRYISKDADNKISNMPESLAPFKYYSSEEKVTAVDRPVMMMDIGGGTTDVVIYEDNEPKILTSFRFAGNSIFGDGFNSNKNMNGFCSRFASSFQKELSDKRLYNLERTLIAMLDRRSVKSEDIATFLFSLADNAEVKKAGAEADLSFSRKMIMDKKMLLIFLLFYHSIMYHLAKMMKCNNMQAPRYILLSGTGSKILQIIDSTKKSSLLSEFAQAIFKDILGEDILPEIKTNTSPKELTCWGGLITNDEVSMTPRGIKRATQILLGDKESTIISNTDPMTYKESEEYLVSVEKEVRASLDLFVKISKEMGFGDLFGVDPSLIEEQSKIMYNKIQEYLKLGLDSRKGEGKRSDKNIDESLFFYPFIGGLNEIAYNLSQKG